MAIGIAPLALAGAAILLLLSGDKKKSAGGGGGGGGGGWDVPPGDDIRPPGDIDQPQKPKAPSAFESCVDPGMPPSLIDKAKQTFEAKGLAPKDYEDVASVYAKAGFPLMAACLQNLAKLKRAEQEVVVAQRGGLPHILRYGDIPSLMAAYYTGSPMRFKEFGPLNPQIGPLKTVNGVTNYTKWIPGTEVLIPAAWNPLDKPIPPPATGGGAKPQPEAPLPKGVIAPGPEDDSSFNA